MKHVRKTGPAILMAVSLGALTLIAPSAGGQTSEAGGKPVVDAAGSLHIPEDYRKTYQYLGSWAVAAEDKGSKQIHVVYVSPGAVEAYQKEGHFPDGAVLVKEVYDATTSSMTTGAVSREDKLDGWFMMVRDSKNTREGNKLWGDGWGWSWFDADMPAKGKTVSYVAECKGCHLPAVVTDWIYVQGYPPLRK